MVTDTCILLVTGAVGAALTFFVNERLGQGPVRSSAGLALLVAGFFYCWPHMLNPYLVKNIPVVFIGGSFIGMVSAKLMSGYFRLAIAGIIFCIIYLNASKFFTGYGGAVGTASSISLLVVLSLPVLNVKGRLTNGFRQVRRVIYGKRSPGE